MILLDIDLKTNCVECQMHQYGLSDHWCTANEAIVWENAQSVPNNSRDDRCPILGEVMNKCGNGTIYDADGRPREYDVYNIWRIGSETP